MKCVQVCPTGIDIRDGVQMECVGCTACIDVCDEVMETLKMDKGLIRYASENEIKTGQKFRFTTKIKAYTALLGVLMLVMVAMVASRQSVDVYISRAGGQLYQKMPNGNISNLFEAKIINKTKKSLPLEFRMENTKADLRIVGYDKMILEPEKINQFTFFLEIPADKLVNYSTKIKIAAYVGDQKIQTVTTNYLGPFK
jgi:polyferredoxin